MDPRSGTRKRPPSPSLQEEEGEAKKRRVERKETEEGKNGRCKKCDTALSYSACRNTKCHCRLLSHQNCAACIDTDPENPEDPDNPEETGNETLNKVEAFRIPAPHLSAAKVTSLRSFLRKEEKKLGVIISDSDQAVVQEMKQFETDSKDPEWIPVPHASNEDLVQQFREKILEWDYGILYLNAANENGKEETTNEDGEDGEIQSDNDVFKSLDEMISKITFSAAKRALLSVVFLRSDSSGRQDALCCLRIKD